MAGVEALSLATQNYLGWKSDLRKLSPYARLIEILERYPKGQPIEMIQKLMNIPRTQKAKRKLDGMLRTLETQGKAKLVRSGDVRLWTRNRT